MEAAGKQSHVGGGGGGGVGVHCVGRCIIRVAAIAVAVTYRLLSQ